MIPMKLIGPLSWKQHGRSDLGIQNTELPLATYETPLWPSCQRGARISREIQGIDIALVKNAMVRSVIFEATDLTQALFVKKSLEANAALIGEIIKETGRFVQLKEPPHIEVLGNLLYCRLAMETGDAAGHNMVTKAADKVMQVMLQKFPTLKYISISGNLCTDKKVSAINGLLGRGKHVVAEAKISAEVCRHHLRTTPAVLANLHLKKNLLGSLLAGSLRSANAHVANMLLAFYLATGQDAANIVEGSQAIVRAEWLVETDELYFMVNLPNVIVGTVGQGKHFDFVQKNLELMGCAPIPEYPGASAERLAHLAAGLAWCGELSLLAAQARPGELVSSHLKLERAVIDN